MPKQAINRHILPAHTHTNIHTWSNMTLYRNRFLTFFFLLNILQYVTIYIDFDELTIFSTKKKNFFLHTHTHTWYISINKIDSIFVITKIFSKKKPDSIWLKIIKIESTKTWISDNIHFLTFYHFHLVYHFWFIWVVFFFIEFFILLLLLLGFFLEISIIYNQNKNEKTKKNREIQRNED